ncbi:unnamed protein product, partial [Oppiella nova]
MAVHLIEHIFGCVAILIVTLLDFEEFTLAPPINGTCSNRLTDSLVITGATNFNDVGLPGDVYLDVDPNKSDQATNLRVTINNQVKLSRKWRIRVRQIENYSPLQAPSGALQYYTGLTATHPKMCSIKWTAINMDYG